MTSKRACNFIIQIRCNSVLLIVFHFGSCVNTRALANVQPIKEHKMKQKDAFFGFSGKNQPACNCGMCAPDNIDWTALTNSEKMVKAMLLKSQITAELNEPLDILVS